MLAAAAGLAIAYFGIYAYHVPLQAAFELAEQQKAAAELLNGNIGIMLRCLPAAALWSATALAIGTAGMNKFLAYISPFICYYVLVIIAERYFRDVFVLNPKNYVTLAGGWEGNSPALISSLDAFTAMLAAYFAVIRRIDGRSERESGRYSEKPITIKERKGLRLPRKGVLGELSEVLAAARFDFSSWRTGPRIALTLSLIHI